MREADLLQSTGGTLHVSPKKVQDFVNFTTGIAANLATWGCQDNL